MIDIPRDGANAVRTARRADALHSTFHHSMYLPRADVAPLAIFSMEYRGATHVLVADIVVQILRREDAHIKPVVAHQSQLLAWLSLVSFEDLEMSSG
jgi:hypothetical protein